MASNLDILAPLQQLLVIAVCLVAAGVIIRFRARFLSLLTGDDRVHGDGFDGVWFVFCRCCGSCTGFWTKYLTCLPCCSLCGLQNRNLVDDFGRWSGILQQQVRVYNIAIGDIPGDGNAYYYVQFEVGEHPPQCTSVSALSHQKLVRFHGELCLMVRESSLDNPIRVVVKELETLGSPEICEVYIRPEQVIEWAKAEASVPMRFQMNPIHKGRGFELPGWVLMTFELLEPWEEHGPLNSPPITVRDTHNALHTFASVTDFKSQHPLRNSRGANVHEPLEADVDRYFLLRRNRQLYVKFCPMCLLLALLLFVTAHLSVVSCFRSYKRMLVLHQHGVEFPASREKKTWVLSRCGYSDRPDGKELWGLIFSDLLQWRIHRGFVSEWATYLTNFTTDRDFHQALTPPKHIHISYDTFGGVRRIKVVPNSTDCWPSQHDVVNGCYNLPIGAHNPRFYAGALLRCRPWTCRYRVLSAPLGLLEIVLFGAWLALLYVLFQHNQRQLQQTQLKLARAGGNSPSSHLEAAHAGPGDSWLCCGSRRSVAPSRDHPVRDFPVSPLPIHLAG
mmetsp:Transcript_57011/g.161884  ORF Transcript_57011/g.161884 Transcript_57011/m.161884 type:complete len:560 (-) Transcript_57011:7-1686(-)